MKPTQLLSGGAGPPIWESASGQHLFQCLALQPEVPFIGGNEGGSGHPWEKKEKQDCKEEEWLANLQGDSRGWRPSPKVGVWDWGADEKSQTQTSVAGKFRS